MSTSKADEKSATMTEAVADVVGDGTTDALKEAGQKLLSLLVEGAARAATERVEGLTGRLEDITEHGLGSVFGGAGAGSLIGSALKAGGSGLTEKVKGALGGAGGKGGGGKGGQGKKLKVTNIVESVDIGLPLRTTYDLWTRFEDFPTFMKKVDTVEQTADETTEWQAQILWSRRNWRATVTEQVPDSHIVWRSTAEKGRVDGAVSFTELGPNLTRVLLVLEYWPKGFFEQTGNLWRAQGRRARLELKHFRRHAMTSVLLRQEEVEGWRGEIRAGEVVRTSEDALAAEREAAGRPDAPGHGSDADPTDENAAEPPDENDNDDEGYADEPGDEVEDEVEDEVDDEDEDGDGDDDEDAYDDAYDDDAYDDEEPGREGDGADTRRRAAARSGGGHR